MLHRIARLGIRAGGGIVVPGLLLLLLLPLAALASPDCRAVVVAEFGGAPKPAAGGVRRPEVQLGEAGRYCLGEDVLQRRLLDPRTGTEIRTIGGDAVFLIGASDIQLDLTGHRVENERALGYTLIKHYRYEPGHPQDHRFSRTRIVNGRLLSPGSRGIGIQLGSAAMQGTEYSASGPQAAAGDAAGDRSESSGHLLENLTIEAGQRAILLEGRNNVIRNSHIIVDSATAIVAQGPGIVIENNVIEVRNDLSRFSEHARRLEARTPFAIRLIAADGAILRNNQIRLLNPAGRPPLPAAVELIRSPGVLLESNRFEGIAAPVRVDDASTFREIDNRGALCAPGTARYLPPADADGAVASGLAGCRQGS
jgi:hypothetical protein